MDLSSRVLQSVADGFLIVTGSTGCGKTSTIPVKLHEVTADTDNRPIIVTVPRRLAATELAARLAKINPHLKCSYHIGSDNKVDGDTDIIFATIGVLLRKLINTPTTYLKYSCIVLDEVHERSVECDILLGLLKVFRESPPSCILVEMTENSVTSPTLVLMSATVKPEKFLNFFGFGDSEENATKFCLELSHETAGNIGYNIEEVFLDEICDFVAEDFDVNDPQFHLTLITLMFDFIRSLKHDAQWNYGTILVFVPGVGQIEEIIRQYDAYYPEKEEYPLMLLPLHANQSEEEQQNVIKVADLKTRKVVLATTVAESSITFKDVRIVVNFCLTKKNVPDQATGYYKLELQWASAQQNIQRRGRCGRVGPGKCLHLVPQKFYYTDRYEILDIHLVNLESVVLLLKKFETSMTSVFKGADFVQHFLETKLLDAPLQSSIHQAFTNLINSGALITITDSVTGQRRLKVTHLGDVMAALPVEHRLSKLILLSETLEFLQDGIYIAAEESIANKEMFKPIKVSLNSWLDKLGYGYNGSSDQCAAMHCYRSWDSKRKEEKGDQVKETMKGASRKRELNFGHCNISFMERMEKMKNELYRKFHKLCNDIKSGTTFKDKSKSEQVTWKEQSSLLLKIVMAGAGNERSWFISKAPDPTSYQDERKFPLRCSVFFKSYTDSITLTDVETYVEQLLAKPQGRRASVTFMEDKGIIVGQYKDFDSVVYNESVHEGVLCALQLEKMKHRSENIISFQVKRNSSETVRDKCYYVMTGFVSPNFFGVIPSTAKPEFEKIKKTLQKMPLVKLQPLLNQYPSLSYGQRCIVSEPENFGPFTMKMLRGEVKLTVSDTKESKTSSVLVNCMDIGVTTWFPVENLYSVPQELTDCFTDIPGLAMQCHLPTIKPVVQLCGTTTWTVNAKNTFSEYVKKNCRNELILQGVRLDEQGGMYVCVDVLGREGWGRKSVVQRMIQTKMAVQCDYHFSDEQVSHNVNQVELSTPYSPLTMSFRPSQLQTKQYDLEVVNSSVNSVILDPDALDIPYIRKMLIAGIVKLGGRKHKKLMLNRTTLLPNVPGIVELICMMFSPVVQVILDRKQQATVFRTFTKTFKVFEGSILEGEAELAVEEDITINLSDEDMEDIRIIRMSLNQLYMVQCNSDLKTILRTKITALLQRRRMNLTPESMEAAWSPQILPSVTSNLKVPLQPIIFHTVQ